jgi:hypothetical protein
MARSFAVAVRWHLLDRWRTSKVFSGFIAGEYVRMKQTLTGLFYSYKSHLFIWLALKGIWIPAVGARLPREGVSPETSPLDDTPPSRESALLHVPNPQISGEKKGRRIGPKIVVETAD